MATPLRGRFAGRDRASLTQLSVDSSDSADERRHRAAAGAWSYDRWRRDAEGVGGPTAEVMSAAARRAGAWPHAGSIGERDGDGTLDNTALLFDRSGDLRGSCRKIHRYGFDTGEATMTGGGRGIVTVATDFGVVGPAICYDLRFPALFRGLLDAGAELIVLPAAWPAARLGHWRLLTRTRALEEQVFLQACRATGTHGGMRPAVNPREVRCPRVCGDRAAGGAMSLEMTSCARATGRAGGRERLDAQAAVGR